MSFEEKIKAEMNTLRTKIATEFDQLVLDIEKVFGKNNHVAPLIQGASTNAVGHVDAHATVLAESAVSGDHTIHDTPVPPASVADTSQAQPPWDGVAKSDDANTQSDSNGDKAADESTK
jgi:hypothetical protein